MKAPASAARETYSLLESRSALQRYGFAVLATGIAFLVRLALDQARGTGDKLPFFAFIIATIFVVWYSGTRPGLVVLVLGFLLADWFFITPRHSLMLGDGDKFAVYAPYLAVELSIIIFGRSMHLARQRADAHAHEAIRHQGQLEQEVLDRKRAEEEIRRLNAELEKRVEQRTAELVASNQELESFTYSVSHDLRAPLRHVDGYAQILEEELGADLPAEAQELTRKIRQGSQNMSRLVDDLLNLSRVGKAELNRRRTDMNPLVQEVVKELRQETANRKINWQIGDLPPVECDIGLMKLVLVNLISNAVKYTQPRAEARIEIGQAPDHGETAFFVRDNGVGFDMKYAHRLFGVFQRLHRQEEFPGTGVGLATVARIVQKHGGRVWAEAVANEGATFFFTLANTNGTPVVAANGKSA